MSLSWNSALACIIDLRKLPSPSRNSAVVVFHLLCTVQWLLLLGLTWWILVPSTLLTRLCLGELPAVLLEMSRPFTVVTRKLFLPFGHKEFLAVISFLPISQFLSKRSVTFSRAGTVSDPLSRAVTNTS